MKRNAITLIFLGVSVILFPQDVKSDLLYTLEKSQPAGQDLVLTATLKSSSRLFELREDLTSVILVIPAGSVVKITGSDSTYFRVVFEQDSGYIFKRHAVINQEPVAMNPVTTQEQEENIQPRQKQETRLFYLENKYGTNMAAKLYANKIWRGMTAQMVRDSWGTPLKINRDTGAAIIREEWVYKKALLYIENNTLVDWSEVKNN